MIIIEKEEEGMEEHQKKVVCRRLERLPSFLFLVRVQKEEPFFLRRQMLFFSKKRRRLSTFVTCSTYSFTTGFILGNCWSCFTFGHLLFYPCFEKERYHMKQSQTSPFHSHSLPVLEYRYHLAHLLCRKKTLLTLKAMALRGA